MRQGQVGGYFHRLKPERLWDHFTWPSAQSRAHNMAPDCPSPCDTHVGLSWDSWKGEATIPLISLFLWLISLDIICMLRIDFFILWCHFQPTRADDSVSEGIWISLLTCKGQVGPQERSIYSFILALNQWSSRKGCNLTVWCVRAKLREDSSLGFKH